MAHPNTICLVAVCIVCRTLMCASSLLVLEGRDYTHTCQAIQTEHSDQWFLYTYESHFDGCTLDCIFLRASDFRHKGYFDKTVTHRHFFSSDKGCIDSHHVSSCCACRIKRQTFASFVPGLRLWSLQGENEVEQFYGRADIFTVWLNHCGGE